MDLQAGQSLLGSIGHDLGFFLKWLMLIIQHCINVIRLTLKAPVITTAADDIQIFKNYISE